MRQKKPRVWPWVLGLIVAVLTLITGCVGVVVALVRAPIGAANEFVALVDDGEYELAYNSLCFTTRAELSQEEFTEHFSAAENITGYTLSSASWVLGELTTVSGTVEINEVPRSISISLARENDQWRVCDYDLIQ